MLENDELAPERNSDRSVDDGLTQEKDDVHGFGVGVRAGRRSNRHCDSSG